MKKLLALCAVLFLAIGAATVLAQPATPAPDATGTWTGTVQGPNGDMTLTFHFKEDGVKLTGTVDSPMGGDPMDISNGKVDGDKVEFDTTFNSTTIHHEGTLSGDEMKLKAKPSDDSFPEMELTLKRGQ